MPTHIEYRTRGPRWNGTPYLSLASAQHELNALLPGRYRIEQRTVTTSEWVPTEGAGDTMSRYMQSAAWTPTSDNPSPVEWECELCGAKLGGHGARCGSAQHGPAGTVIYGRAVPAGGAIPDSQFVGEPETDT